MGSASGFTGNALLKRANAMAALGLRACAGDKAVSASDAWLRGFTTIELMVTVAVLGITLAIAGPALFRTVQSNRVVSQASEFRSALTLAKNEATTRRQPVVIRATGPSSANEFGGGWTVFVDLNNNGTFDAGDTLLKQHASLVHVTLSTASGATSIAFGSNGFLNPVAQQVLAVCPDKRPSSGVQLTVLPSGLVYADPNPVPSFPCP